MPLGQYLTLALMIQDHHPTLWFSDDGYRVGTYNGHNGAVWTCDITCECTIFFVLLQNTALLDSNIIHSKH